MARLLFRLVGLLFLAGAFVALVVDGTRSVAAGEIAIVPFGRTLSTVFPAAFEASRHAIEAHLPILWDPILVTVFLLPTWLVLGMLGLFIFALTRRSAPKIGYSRR